MIRRFQIYDKDIYADYGEMPELLEINIGSELIQFADKNKKENLCDAITKVRNSIEKEYGLFIPQVRIRDCSDLKPYEYSILINGIKFSSFADITNSQLLCLDTGDVTEKLHGDYKHVNEPSFGFDGIVIDSSLKKEAESRGYNCIDILKIIQVNLCEIVRNNLTKFLNQNSVNILINRVRPNNPDVVDYVFFKKSFSASKIKIVLNMLLEEKVSIRDMNTILETIADNLDTDSTPLFLAEKIRENLAYQFLSKYADENKVIKVITIGKCITEKYAEKLVSLQDDNEQPFFSLEKKDRDEFFEKMNEVLDDKSNDISVFLCVSSLRKAFSNLIRKKLSEAICISDKEAWSCNTLYSFEVIGEIDV